MNRRSFLAVLGGAALDPERLLWRPGRKLISIPRPMAPWERPYVMLTETMTRAEFARRYSRGPFLVTSHFGNPGTAQVLEGLMNYRYATDPAFARRLDNALGLRDRLLVDDIARSELREVQAGRGYYGGFLDDARVVDT